MKYRYIASIVAEKEREPFPSSGWNSFSGETEREAVAKALQHKRTFGASKHHYKVIVSRTYGKVEEPLSYTLINIEDN
ncbi:MAG: hypothetical protein E6Q97_30890 [Desulfurellales bacterium]|nr:MAG: hypothetical protein E6Q97_30890 [Desulfurellales bacterium]